MNSATLYRKYRPTTFSKVYGQSVIVRTLTNQILQNSISHAYLFCGPRGTGKTSTAKIFAKAINCENNIDGNPCKMLMYLSEKADIIERNKYVEESKC